MKMMTSSPVAMCRAPLNLQQRLPPQLVKDSQEWIISEVIGSGPKGLNNAHEGMITTQGPPEEVTRPPILMIQIQKPEHQVCIP